MTHFFDLTPDALGELCAEIDLPSYAADQILDWVYRKGVTDPHRMTNLSRSARTKLAERIEFCRGEIVAHQTATDGTEKLLLGWREEKNERRTECVMIPTDRRRTACISSQVGCPVGCAFCASGIGGLEGNLTCGQIVEQVFHLQGRHEGTQARRHEETKERRQSESPCLRPFVPPCLSSRITHIVFMGMGEPLANYKAVTDAVRTLNAPWGFGISARRITISTVGLPAAIRKLVTFEIPVTLALSLHAPNDEVRRKLIPWAQYATIAELLDACDEYFQKTGREITLEYILLGAVNDQRQHALELARVAKRLRSNVNLIRYNEVKGLPFARPATNDVREFQRILRERGVNTHIRASRGRDIAAACGQLRHERAAISVTHGGRQEVQTSTLPRSAV